MKIYTKTGDAGKTGLIGGTRVSKGDLRLDAYGTIDELNAFLGYLISILNEDTVKEALQNIQQKLFVVGSYLATDRSQTTLKEASIISEEDIKILEETIDTIDKQLPPLKYFIVPGGSTAASSCHICRTVSRRAEREIIRMKDAGIEISEEIMRYMNRLSDYFFVLSRYINENQGVSEIYWKL